jgi:hypothetical protein
VRSAGPPVEAMSESATKRKGEGEDGQDVKKAKAEEAEMPVTAEAKPRRLPTAGRKCMPRSSEDEYEEEEEDREEAPAAKAKKAKAKKAKASNADGVVISLGGTRQVTGEPQAIAHKALFT